MNERMESKASVLGKWKKRRNNKTNQQTPRIKCVIHKLLYLVFFFIHFVFGCVRTPHSSPPMHYQNQHTHTHTYQSVVMWQTNETNVSVSIGVC